jgi:DNA end-binding protein Ku
MGSATISFGLVSVPVKMFSTAESSRNIAFNWIHKKCGSRVRMKYYCPADEELVDRDDLIKGYEFSKDQYVLFDPEEIKRLEAESSNSIDIAEFVPFGKVERIYLDKAYYLGPDKGGERAYRLLSAALKKTKRAAIGRYAARGKQYLVLVRPVEDGLLMEQLRYSDEIRSFADIQIENGKVDKEEQKLAVQLIEQAATDEFRPERFEDEVYQRTMELIEKKIQGEEISAAPMEEPETKIIDLMEALKASLDPSEEPTESGKAGRKPAKRAAPRRKKKVAGSGKRAGG